MSARIMAFACPLVTPGYALLRFMLRLTPQ
jgi:hypothetical protein